LPFTAAPARRESLKVFDMATRQLRITGMVQGVGYRDALRREAAKLGVTGWVRNRADQSVEALVQGSADALDALTAWARRGPPAARVAAVTSGPPAAEHERSYERFDIWSSA
jgi:acylphosphatase